MLFRSGGDFYGSEKSTTVKKATDVRIEFVAGDGKVTVLKKKLDLVEGEVIDAAVMNVRALRKFFGEQIEDAKKNGVLLSLHLKCTMMKVSDPIIFGAAVDVFYKDVFTKYAGTSDRFNINLCALLGSNPAASAAHIGSVGACLAIKLFSY